LTAPVHVNLLLKIEAIFLTCLMIGSSVTEIYGLF
jgi:hypothetical protein